MRYWLMKTEPTETSIDDAMAAPQQTVGWDGVRNYQARNFMLHQMQIGDGILFYHSSCAQPGIVGLAEVVSEPYPDPTQFDPGNPHYDPKSDPAEPRWAQVDIKITRKINLISLVELRRHASLRNMRVLMRGNRLSITPVSTDEWRFITGQLADEVSESGLA